MSKKKLSDFCALNADARSFDAIQYPRIFSVGDCTSEDTWSTRGNNEMPHFMEHEGEDRHLFDAKDLDHDHLNK